LSAFAVAAAKDSTQKIHPALKNAKGAELVPVIIEFDAGAEPDKKMLKELGCESRHVLKSLNGISAECPAGAIEPLALLDTTAYVWEDQILSLALDESVPLINATAGWQDFGDGAGINVSIIDSGITTSHPALTGQVILENDFTPEGITDDLCNHGTPVACVVGCNDETYKGVAPGAKMFNAKVARVVSQNPLQCGILSSDAIAAIDWSIANSAQVIVLSMASPTSSCYQNAIAVAVNNSAKNVTIVIAAGNSGPGDSSINVPGCAENALTVGASNGDSVEDYSSRGPTDYGVEKPDLVAPGTGITAASNDGATFSDFTGTSFAAPHAAGVVALMLQQKRLNPLEVKQIINTTSVDIGYGRNTQGAGRIDAWAAVNKTNGTAGPTTFGIILQPDASAGKDAHISSASPNTNYGNADPMKVQTNSLRALIGWNLSSIPANADISSAVMQMYVPSVQKTSGNTVNAYRITRQWYENNVTWNKYDGTHSWTTTGGDYDSTIWASMSVGAKGKYYSWDLTQLVKSWQNSTYQNYGIIMVSQSSNNRKDVSSSDCTTASRRPALLVNYTL
jgi:serine protease AprX